MKRIVLLVLLVVAAVVAYFNVEPLAQDSNEVINLQLPLEPSKHAACRMDCRSIDMAEIKDVLTKGKLNPAKTRSDNKGITYAFEGVTHDQQKVRIVIAPKSNKNVIVTVIDLDKEWACDCP